MNKVILVGFVGQAPETKKFEGWQKSSFSLATTGGYKDRCGAWVKTTEWHNIQCSGRNSEVVEAYVRKGDQLLVEGEIRYNSYEKDGQKRYITNIVASRIKLLERRREESGKEESYNNDDLPFA